MTQKKSIAISACLLGHKVRYDGEHQASAILLEGLPTRFNIIPVCPEIEIGLGVPRTKIALYRQGSKICLLSTTQPVIDLTERMMTYAQLFMDQYALAGLVLKDKSPSCGINNCKIWDEQGSMQRNASGIFAAAIMQLQPNLPIWQSNAILGEGELQEFIQQVGAYAD
ncbi:MAG: hypothetical protein methR_P2895 [Methyloprofundus sp.]|nr:MAG: hypothetical protein methR_P2895 [Methyloprofundus sp.]